jgi:hypothetical protein
MMCGRPQVDAVERVVPLAKRPQHERITDAERSRSAAVVTAAAGDGLLTLTEVDERLAAVWAARTAGDLAAVEAELPESWLAERRRAERRVQARDAARATLGGHVRSYLSVMALLFGIWAVISITAGELTYLWPLWPAFGWGIGVVSHARAAYGRDGQPTGRELPA